MMKDRFISEPVLSFINNNGLKLMEERSMRKKKALNHLMQAVLMTIIFTFLIPASVFAATKYRRLKTSKEYNYNGELTVVHSYTYDNYGTLKKYSKKYRDYDRWVTDTTTYSRKYYSNGYYKTVISKSSDGRTNTTTYDINGYIKKSTDKWKSGGETVTSVTTYNHHSNGTIVASTTVDKILDSKTIYDANGRKKKLMVYDRSGKKVTRTEFYSYKISKGRITEETIKDSTGYRIVSHYKYNKKGDQSMYSFTETYKNSSGKLQKNTHKETYKYKYNKDGSIKEQTTYNALGNLSSRVVNTYTNKKY